MEMDVFIFTSVLLHDFAESAKRKLLAEEAFPNTLLKVHILHAISFVRSVSLPTNTVTVSGMQWRVEAISHAYPISKAPSSAHAFFLWYSSSEDCKTSSHKTVHTPVKVLCYHSLIESIQEYVRQDGFLNLFSQESHPVQWPISF